MSIPRLPETLLMVALLAPVAAFCAADTDTDAAQRQRIARERATIERAMQVAQAACATQFAVTACVDGVKAERRQRLQTLDRQRAVLDDELRKRRAAERIEQIRRRQAARADERPQVSVRARSPAASEAAAAAPAPEPSLDAALASRQAAPAQAQAGAAARAAAARRASDAAAHRNAVDKRNQVRAKQREPARPLPLPAAVAASQALR
ncbi:MAG: hypothetical protein Q8L49_04845 [Burkholderiaceae bacterium]|nr:hypothetical protein [Burkholderiaceae bacterium]